MTEGQRMRMRRLVGVLVPVAWFAAGCGGGPAPPPYRPVADNKLLMNAVIDPAADKIWASAGSVITAAGIEDIKPKDDEEWMAVKNAAVTLTESGNLLMMVPRARDGGEWMRLSKALVDTSEAAIQAADARNVDKIFTIGGDIYVICSNCHAKYMERIVKASE